MFTTKKYRNNFIKNNYIRKRRAQTNFGKNIKQEYE